LTVEAVSAAVAAALLPLLQSQHHSGASNSTTPAFYRKSEKLVKPRIKHNQNSLLLIRIEFF